MFYTQKKGFDTFAQKLFVMLCLCGITSLGAQTDSLTQKKDTLKEKKLPLVAERKIDIKTNRGTWMSLDVSPDGQTIAFDLLGDLYEMPIGGGKATRITAGLAFDSQPKYAPDGKSILFLSDRSGGNNVWYIDRENKDTVQVTKGDTFKIQSAQWSPDGNYIVVSKGTRNLKLHLYHKEGGGGKQLLKEPESLKAVEPEFSPDGRYIWYAKRTSAWQYNAQFPQYQLAVYDREDGTTSPMTSRYGSAFTPTLSPDGKWLVYGTRYNDKTGLIARNLATQDEKWLAYPVQRDEQESIAPLGVLPAMSFTPDSQTILTTYGGKIYRIPINGGPAQNIPFEVEETLVLGPQLKFDYPIEDSATFEVTQIRDPKISPDGTAMAFTALDRLYVMDLKTKTHQRLTSFNHVEAQPTWSPNSKEIAFVTWDKNAAGHLYKVRADGKGKPIKLTTKAAVYSNPAWHDSNRIAVFEGARQQFQNASGPRAFMSKTDLVWIDGLKGGASHFISKAHHLSQPHFVHNENRIYLNHAEKGLVSIRWDGTDLKQYVKVEGITVYGSAYNDQHLLSDAPSAPEKKPSQASIILKAPKGTYALAQINNDIYVVTVPYIGAEPTLINVSDPEAAAFPALKLTEIGGQFPSWSQDGNTVYWSIGNAFFAYNIATALAEKKAAERKEENGEEEEEEKEEDGPAYSPNEFRVRVAAKRDIPKATYLLTNATLITMEGDEIIEKGAVLIENNRIKAVGPLASMEVSPNVHRIDVSGKYILPGFVDTHAHMWPSWDLHKNENWMYAANLAYGVTTTRDPQTGTTDVLTYADRVKAGNLIGPRVYSTGPGVGYWGYNIKSLEHARNVLKQYSEYYNTKTIKMYLTGNRKHRQWIIQAAKEQKLMPTTEGGLDFKLNLTQIIDGYPGHEHSFPVYPLYDDFISFVAQSQTAYTPTLLVSYGGPWAENYYYATENVQYDPKLNRFTPKSELDAKSRRRNAGWFMKEEHVFDDHAVFVKDLVEAGGIAGVGSHGQLQGLGYHWELWSMQSGGISNHNALKVATLLGADAIGLAKDLGSITPGKLADLLVLDKNPLDQIRNTNSLRYVIKNGRVYEADSLDELYPNPKKFGVKSWQESVPENVPGLSAN